MSAAAPEEIKTCNKCHKEFIESQTRIYKLSTKNNIDPNSWLARADRVILCFGCDSRRTTNLIEYLK